VTRNVAVFSCDGRGETRSVGPFTRRVPFGRISSLIVEMNVGSERLTKVSPKYWKRNHEHVGKCDALSFAVARLGDE
jgi:hypothetical protein